LFINTPQAAEVMLYTVDKVNSLGVLPPPLKLGAYVLDDCDKDTYGLQQAVDFIKGKKCCFFLY
jgi:metabotropic X receptor